MPNPGTAKQELYRTHSIWLETGRSYAETARILKIDSKSVARRIQRHCAQLGGQEAAVRQEEGARRSPQTHPGQDQDRRAYRHLALRRPARRR